MSRYLDIVKRSATRIAYNARNAVRLVRFAASYSPETRRGKVLFLDAPDPRLERYYYLLAKYFDLAGWNLVVKFSADLFLNLRNFNELLLNIPSLKVVWSEPRNYDLRITNGSAVNEKTLLLDVNYFSKHKQPGDLTLPYSMHPEMYDSGISDRLTKVRHDKRRIRVLSAGNTGAEYDNPDIRDLFGKTDRRTITDLLEGKQTQLGSAIISNEKGFQNVLAQHVSVVQGTKELKLSIEEWMAALGDSDFYIAAPGVSMPFSHNAIEAMAAGTIPILEYGDMFTPPLVDGVHCVTYVNGQDLLNKIEICLKMSESEVTAIRYNVIAYYEDYLSPSAVVANLWSNRATANRVYMNAEHLSVMALKTELSQL